MARAPVKFEGSRTVKGSVAQYEVMMDPQRWQDNIPALWTSSRVIQNPDSLPADRNVDPPLAPVKDEIDEELFFEVVVIPFLARYRNILWTTLRKTKGSTGQLEKIEFEYWQYDCLTGEFFGQKSYGSIDVDRGGATCQAVGADHVEIKISKTVRFTQPDDNLEFVDLFGRIAVPAVLELLLFGLDLTKDDDDGQEDN